MDNSSPTSFDDLHTTNINY